MKAAIALLLAAVATPAAAKGVLDNPYTFLWSRCAMPCDNQAFPPPHCCGPALDGLASYDIQPEGSFRLFSEATGFYPWIDPSSGTFHNGGIPQAANLSKHLGALVAIVQASTPDGFAGVCTLDYESWRADWNTTHDLYKQASIDRVAKMHPTWSPAAVNASAETEYEAAAKEFMLRSIDAAKAARPDGLWSFYGYPQNPSLNVGPIGRDERLRDDRLQWLFNATDVVMPSIYEGWPGGEGANLPSGIKPFAQIRAYVGGVVAEALRVSRAAGRPTGPVLPFATYVYDQAPGAWRGQRLMAPADLALQLTYANAAGAAGVVVYESFEGAWYNCSDTWIQRGLPRAPPCPALQQFIDGTLGPIAAAFFANRTACSAAHCHGHGACVPTRAQEEGEATAALACRCYTGWAGQACEDAASRALDAALVVISVVPSPTPTCHQQANATQFVCGDLSAALAQATSVFDNAGGSAVNVTVTLPSGGVVSAEGQPFKGTAPALGLGTLRLEGQSPAGATIDGGHRSALLTLSGGSVAVANVAFRNGWVNATHGKGQAPVILAAKSALLDGCAFDNNRGFDGGALAIVHGDPIVIRDCTFNNNTAYHGGDGHAHDTGGGGAIFNDRATVFLQGSTFEDCVATDPPGVPRGTTGGHHGGAVMNVLGKVYADNCTFARGNAYQGGALYTWMWGELILSRSIFVNNTAIGATHNTGGAIFTDRGSAVIRDSSFVGNVANNSGGAIFGWSANGSCRNATTGAKGCNHTGPACVCQNVTIERCSFVDNVARSSKHFGGAVSNQWSTFFITNSTCKGNKPHAVWSDPGGPTHTTITGGTCKL